MTSVFQFVRAAEPDVDRLLPGEWLRVVDENGRPSAIVRCPNCKRTASLDHDIAADGMITPSLVCPQQHCSFHVMGQLIGWEP